MKMKCLFAGIIVCMMVSCNKGPGTGGNASIEGYVHVLNYRSYSAGGLPPYFYVLDDSYSGGDELVYLVYGDDTTYSESVRTRYDGRFFFDYLRKGKYRVYVLTRDTNAVGTTRKIANMVTVEITGRKQKLDVDTLIMMK